MLGGFASAPEVAEAAEPGPHASAHAVSGLFLRMQERAETDRALQRALEENDDESEDGSSEGGAAEPADRGAALLQMVRLMRERVLCGQETEVDCGVVDADTKLDERWAVERRRDAEDRYFDESDGPDD